MELEFDKEIDAILRRARSTRGVLVGDDPAKPKKHLDADTIAAFAENALPQKAKLLYMEHFADCDRCRKLLSQTIAMNTEADAATAASSVSAPITEPAIPWYQKLFKPQNLALAMGSLALVFTAVLGYLMLQNRNTSTDATVSQVTEPQSPQGGTFYNEESANTAANTASPANAANTATSPSAAANANIPAYNAPNAPANQPPNSTGMPLISSNTAPPGAFGRLDSTVEKKAEKDDKTAAAGGAMTPAAKPAAPPTTDLLMAGRN